ncbi:MAG: KilA-N domain-containing protein [Rhizonema sp. NSF051]|nr:KilA-N domain-containing protein [Rhizonema sp. NSF051]
MANQDSTTNLLRKINGIIISQNKSDGYIDATAMCRAHNAKNKEKRKALEWLSNERTITSIFHLAKKLEIVAEKEELPKVGKPAFAKEQNFWGLVQVKAGRFRDDSGTWIHPKLASRFGIWLSDDFGYVVEEWIEEWIMTGKNPIYQTREDIILALVPEKPKKWEKRYGEDFWRHLERLTTYRQGNIQCAFFINDHIYDYFPKDVRVRLDEVNPLMYGRRPHKQHQHFNGELLTALQFHILAVLTIMEASSSHQIFLEGMQAKFQGIYALKLPRF